MNAARRIVVHITNFRRMAKLPRTRALSSAAGLVLFAACAGSVDTSSRVEIPRPLPAPTSATPATSAAAPKRACDEDDAESFDCARLSLGECGAATYYACPTSAGLPAGAGLRKAVAARVAACLARPGFDGRIAACVPSTEACVREAVGASCFDAEALETCKRELATCSGDEQALCARLLTSLEPTTRKSALDDLHDQRRSQTCDFDWDLNGFPFCPFCPFRH